MKHFLPVLRASLLIALWIAPTGPVIAERPSDQAPSGSNWHRTPNRERMPRALRNVPLERLSSGALLRLDLNGDLVEPPEVWASRVAEIESSDRSRAAAVPLDRRVGANIRLGDDPPALPSTRRSQAEPHIARAPGDPDFLLATFQEGRFGNGGAVDCGYSVSHDGGLTWTRALIPKLGRPDGGVYDRATDPVAGIDLAGNAFLNTLGLADSTSSRGEPAFDGSVVVSRSTDGGATFGSPVLVYKEPNADSFADKNWMTINNFADTPTAGRIVVTFTVFSNIGGTSHPIMRAFSDDHGVTWSSAAFIHATSLQVQGSQPVFLRDGKLVIVYWNFMGTASYADDRLELVVSNDGGNTFGTPRPITNVNIYGPQNIRTGAFLPSATSDRTSGAIYVTYQALHLGSPRIMFTKSTNAGETWTTPVPVSNNPAGSDLFNPAIASSPDGQTLTVSFYDMRDNPNSNTLVDMYLAQSLDGGATWQPNIRLTSESTDAALAVNTGTQENPSYMLGDYLGIAGSTDPNVPAVPVWVDTRTGNPDPFVTRVGLAAELNFTSWQAARLSLDQITDPELGGPSGDADNDGEQNSVEFKYGTEPNDPASIFHTGRQLNISTRARVLNGDNILIGGFIVTGADAKRVIIRALGPSLVGSGVPGRLQNPTLELRRGSGGPLLAANDNWRESQQGEIEATGIPPADERESAIVATLAPGDYTALVRGRQNTTGVAVVEVYDLAQDANSELANISSRGFVGVDDNVMIGGVIIGGGEGTGGAGTARVVVRGLGPSLAQSGVTGFLQDPELLLHDANGSIITTSDNWRQTQQTEIQSLNLAPTDDREAALVTTLQNGNYTAILRGRGRSTGVALIEAYNVR